MSKKMIENILNEIEQYGECFIGTIAVQGEKAFRRYWKVGRAYEERHPGKALAYDSETGYVWESK